MMKALLIALTIISAPSLAFDVPVSDLDAWQVLAFRNIPANTVTANDDVLDATVPADEALTLLREIRDALRRLSEGQSEA